MKNTLCIILTTHGQRFFAKIRKLVSLTKPVKGLCPCSKIGKKFAIKRGERLSF